MSREPYSSAAERWFERLEAAQAARLENSWVGRDPAMLGRATAGPGVLLVAMSFWFFLMLGGYVGEYCINAFGLTRGAGTAIFVVVGVVGWFAFLMTLQIRAALRQAARAQGPEVRA